MITNAPTLSERLAHFICTYADSGIPSEVYDDAVYRVLDIVGVSIRALQMEGSDIPIRSAKQLGGTPESTIIGTSHRTGVIAAAFANGCLTHWPDFDDTDSNSMFHPSSVAVPVAFALAEKLKISGRRCLAAVIVGAEVGIRVARCARHQFQKRGYHATGVSGPFAAAAVAARLMELDEKQTTSALGLAGCLAAGLIQGHSDGSWGKRFYSGWASHTGIMAAMLAADGAVGSAQIFEGTAGFYRVLLGELSESITLDDVVVGLGEQWVTPETTFKPYPSAAWTHSAIDAVISIMRSEKLTDRDVEAIECRLPSAAIPLVCEPREAKVRPKTAYHMKFSVPFTVAMAAALGRLDLDDFNETVRNDSRVLDLAERVSCVADTSLAAQGFPVRVRLTAGGGKVYARDVVAQRGGPGNPMSRDELLEKFARNVESRLGPAGTSKLSEAILSLTRDGDPGAVMALAGRTEA